MGNNPYNNNQAEMARRIYSTPMSLLIEALVAIGLTPDSDGCVPSSEIKEKYGVAQGSLYQTGYRLGFREDTMTLRDETRNPGLNRTPAKLIVFYLTAVRTLSVRDPFPIRDTLIQKLNLNTTINNPKPPILLATKPNRSTKQKLEEAEDRYKRLIFFGISPEKARSLVGRELDNTL